MLQEQPRAAWTALLEAPNDAAGAVAALRAQARPALDNPAVVELVGAPLKPLPWDAHTYNWVEPPELPARDRLAWGAIRGVRRLIEEYYRNPPERREPLPPGRQLPASYEGAQLPAWDRLSLPSQQLTAEPDALAGVLFDAPTPWAPGEGMGALDVVRDSDLFKSRIAFNGVACQMFDAWLSAIGIRYFSSKELCIHKWRFPLNAYVIKGIEHGSWAYLYTELRMDWLSRVLGFPIAQYVVPHPEDWPRILPVLILLDRFRHWMGEAVQIISGYRHPSYNTRPPKGSGLPYGGPGGATDSRHMSFEACDFMYREPDPLNSRHINPRPFLDFYHALYPDSSDGIGVYDTFIHLDRGTRGRNKAKRWNQRSDERDARLHQYRGNGPVTSKR